MSYFRSEDTRYNSGSSSRSFPRRDDRDGRMYDDNPPPLSHSPGGTYLPASFPQPPYTLLPEPLQPIEDVIIHEIIPILGRATAVGTAMTYGNDPRDHLLDGHGIATAIVIAKDIAQEVEAEATAEVEAEVHAAVELNTDKRIEGLEEVRVIRDRQTKISRQLGFLRFRNLGHSRSFVERNFPTIYLCGPSALDDRGTKVRIAYSREREDRAKARAEGDWACMMCNVVNYSTRQRCFRCQAPRNTDGGPAGPPGIVAPRLDNHGDNDAAPENQPSQFLLFRGLEASVTEELLAKGVAKLYRPNSSDNASVTQRKGAKVASTTGDSNLGAREGSLRRVLLVRDRRSNESWRYGFAEFATIQDAQAAVSRLYSFEKFTISSKPVMVSYIHAGVFVPVMNPVATTEQFTFSPLSNPAMKLMYWDEEAYVTELTVSTDSDSQQAPKNDKQVGQSEAKAREATEKAKKRKADVASTATGAKKMAMPSHLQFWSNRHAELHGIKNKDADTETKEESESPAALPRQSYGDPNRNCCYLCMRQFKTMAEVNRHERLSQLHTGNLQKEELVIKATHKLIKHGIIPPSPEYRDRARERRKAFGRSKNATAKPAPAPEPEPSPPAESISKGASLLSKMGWSAGSGLGAQGSGITAPISTEVYAQGVGLGAQGGKLGEASEEAARNTRNRYDEFLEKTRQTARSRYEQFDKDRSV
ncbi:hypothetical protein BJY04DRAFT_215252 [Aspergillus karnatakaensis]|uniref:putative G-patch domain protein n=1 Tax=Aspergillus karnatakaensis TaxID=1810916 RepID=UPI003CCCBF43